MATVLRRNRKGSDAEIVRLNSLGYSLYSIAKRLDCHHTSVSQRLKSLNIPTADNRWMFMEDVFSTLPEHIPEAVADLLAAEDPARPRSIKDLVRELLLKAVAERQPVNTLSPTPSQEDPASHD